MIYVDFRHIPNDVDGPTEGPFEYAQITYGELWARGPGEDEPRLIAVQTTDKLGSLWCDAYGVDYTDVVVYHMEES